MSKSELQLRRCPQHLVHCEKQWHLEEWKTFGLITREWFSRYTTAPHLTRTPFHHLILIVINPLHHYDNIINLITIIACNHYYLYHYAFSSHIFSYLLLLLLLLLLRLRLLLILLLRPRLLLLSSFLLSSLPFPSWTITDIICINIWI